MFERVLEKKLTQIFKLKRATFNAPSESAEQDVLFIEIDSAHTTLRSERAHVRARGKIRVFATSEKMPFGFFTKSIEQAGDEASCFFFHDLEENAGRFSNLIERSASFVFFYNGEYDPKSGTITSIIFNEQVSE